MYESSVNVMAVPCGTIAEERKSVKETLIRVEEVLNETMGIAHKTLELVQVRPETKAPTELPQVRDMMSQADSLLAKAIQIRATMDAIADKLGLMS